MQVDGEVKHTTSFRIIVSALAPGFQSSSTILGNRFSNIHVQDPDFSSKTFAAVSRASSPNAAANPIPSLAARM